MRYQHVNGRTRLPDAICNPDNPSRAPMARVRQSFDQEAATVLSARLAVDRTEMENVADARPSLGRPDLF